MREAAAFSQAEGRTTVPLELAPYGSVFVVFRRPIPSDRQGSAPGNVPRLSESVELKGPWTVRFDPAWGGPGPVRFDALLDWSKSDADGIRYFSGTAIYECERFERPASRSGGPASPVWLDLGDVRNVAEVRLNGKDLGVVWTRPFRVEIGAALQPAGNRLEIRVTNLWPNRLIGDAALPAEKRLTRTHVAKFKKGSPLLPSGLLGPVRLLAAE
jgi:hypothetical protein